MDMEKVIKLPLSLFLKERSQCSAHFLHSSQRPDVTFLYIYKYVSYDDGQRNFHIQLYSTGDDMKKSIGIDIAKDSYTISIFDGKKHELKTYSNDRKGHRKFLNYTKKFQDSFYIMEPASKYHCNLLNYICDQKLDVCLINPLIVKAYKNMKMLRVKTDPVDAKAMAEYAYEYEKNCRKYISISNVQKSLKCLVKARDDLKTTKADFIRRLKAYEYDPFASETVKIYRKLIKEFNEKIKAIDQKIDKIIKANFKRERELLMSIPGIGKVLSSSIIACFGSFETFDKSRQVTTFLGLVPLVYQSGNVYKTKISKIGNKYLRRMFYLAALSASKHNKQCRELYERLLEKGKSKKSALLAVANKLCRQCFGVLKSGVEYNPNYVQEVYIPNYKKI